MILIETLVL